MSAPLVKGLVIGTSILLAAGLALYESEQFQTWFEAQRRRIVMTLDSLANAGASREQQTRRAEEMETELREQVVRRHRADIIQRAKEEGVAVDLDELEAVESIYDAQQALLDEAAKNKREREQAMGGSLSRRTTARSFDELVGHDGRLRREVEDATSTGAVTQQDSGLRQRGTGASGFSRGAAFGMNPFDDDVQSPSDGELAAPKLEQLTNMLDICLRSAREAHISSITSVEVQDSSSRVESESPYKTDVELDAEIQEAIKRSLDDVAMSTEHEQPLIVVDDTRVSRSEMLQMPSSASASSLLNAPAQTAADTGRSQSPSMQGSLYESYYYGGPQQPRSSTLTPENPHPAASVSSFHSTLSEQLASLRSASQDQTSHQLEDAEVDWDSDDALTPAGTLTPPEYAFPVVENTSVTGDVSPVISGSRSRTMSNAGSVAISEDFSEISDGVMTPASWTDVDSVQSEEEEGEQRPRRIIVR